jgi:hypothetical protein
VTTLKRTTGFLALAACLVAVGCGSDDDGGAPIPADIAGQLETRLDEIQRRFDFGGGACADIDNDSLPAVEDLINSIPNNVDPDVREALTDGFNRLFVLTDEQCEKEPQTNTETNTAPPTTETQTTPPETTETTPPPTETEEPPPTETEEPPTTDTPPAPTPGEGGDAPGGEGGSGGSGQGGDATGGQGGGALVPEDEG